MKRYIAAVMFALITVSCSDSTGPDDDDNNAGTTPLATETIGTSGGLVAAQSIAVTIPAGSFSYDEVISIIETENTDHGENAVSKTYLVTGIPADYATPLSLTLVYTGDLANETYLVVEEPAVEPLTGEIILVPEFLPVTISGDSLTGVLPPLSTTVRKNAGISDEKKLRDFYVSAITDISSAKETSHFDIHLPFRANNFNENLESFLNQTYDDIEALGFDFSLTGNNFGKIDSIYVYCEEEVFDPPVFEFILPTKTSGKAIMMIDESYLRSFYLEELKFDAIRSLATITAFYYSVTDSRKPTLWFDIAMADWLARKWYDGSYDPPSPLDNNPLAVFSGIPSFESSEQTAIIDGFAQSRKFTPLIAYFDDLYNFLGPVHTLANIYDERYKGADLATSIETVTTLDPTEWWPGFIKAYMTGETGSVAPETFLTSSAHSGQVTLTESDTLHYFNGSFGDLDADIYQITIDEEYIDTISSLEFSAESSGLQDEYLELLLFGVADGKPYYIGSGINSAIADVSEASDTDTFLAVVASCLIDYPYRDDVPYTIEVAGKGGSNINLSHLNSSFVSIGDINGEFSGSGEEISGMYYSAPGSATGENVFVSHRESHPAGYTIITNITITVDPARGVVSTFEADCIITDWDDQIVEQSALEGYDIPMTANYTNLGSDLDYVRFELNGPSVKSHITDFSYYREGITLEDYTADEDTYIHIGIDIDN